MRVPSFYHYHASIPHQILGSVDDDPPYYVEGSKGEYPYDVGKHLLVMANLFSYADDSGTHEGAEYCLIVGYIASPRQWKLFRSDWKKVLGKIPEFHSIDYFPRDRWVSRKSPYCGWTEAKAKTFIDKLVGVIASHKLAPIGGALKVSEFLEFSEEQRLLINGASLFTNIHRQEGGPLEIQNKVLRQEASPRPYFVPFMGLLTEAVRASVRAHDAKVHLYFDEKKDQEARAIDAYGRFKKNYPDPATVNLVGITHASSLDETPLQAADLYAYVLNRHLRGKTTPELRRIFPSLLRKKESVVVAGRDYCNQLLEFVKQDSLKQIRQTLDV